MATKNKMLKRETVKTSLDQQIEEYEKILSKNPEDLSVLMAYAESNMRRGMRLTALSAYQKILQKKPNVLDVHLALARIYGAQRMLNECFQELKKAVILAPNSPEARLLLRKLAEESDNKQEINDYLQTIPPFEPEKDELENYIKQLEIEKSRLEKHISEYQDILSQNSSDTVVEYNLKMSEQRQKFVEDILKEAEKLIGDIPLTAEETAAATPAEDTVIISITPEQITKAQETLTLLTETKGILGVELLTASGNLIAGSGTGLDDSRSKVVQGLVNIFKKLKEINYGGINYWIGEYVKGLIIVMPLSSDIALAIISDMGTNFGTLRFHLEKYKSSFQKILKIS